ncbi:hypothetical protein CYMTET_50884 [Cymbomonas tetramitiformis]|uniref:phosphoenolpyruvate carboxykinase (ATP) n=1 Tax=Cymbomonas tetramitiformis TaxID=36881 RepID=A0AAE0EUB2_9CHLO|nr:hypothetical protein CYMTET_50884 [Cymbomonas tetramitiformis]
MTAMTIEETRHEDEKCMADAHSVAPQKAEFTALENTEKDKKLDVKTDIEPCALDAIPYAPFTCAKEGKVAEPWLPTTLRVIEAALVKATPVLDRTLRPILSLLLRTLMPLISPGLPGAHTLRPLCPAALSRTPTVQTLLPIIAPLLPPTFAPSFLDHPACKRNLSYEALRWEVVSRGEGRVVDNDVMLVDTGAFTGRCPKDRYVVDAGEAHRRVGWGEVNIPLKEATFDEVYAECARRLWGLKTVYVFDGFVGASKSSRLAVRVVTELAWHHHFCTNMFRRPTNEELAEFCPDITILNSGPDGFARWREAGLRSATCVALDLNRRMGVIMGTQYSGEMKKGAFSMMNYLLPRQGTMSMHCSATVGAAGDAAIFFGLSGTGKTTLSADPERLLVGDDEHGWDEEGVFNLEGGCYAKLIDLDPLKEALIHAAVRRNALLENVVVDASGMCNYCDKSRTENTRCSYPMWHIPSHVPGGCAGHPRSVIFLTCDAFGVLPPVSVLSEEQALYHFVSGYTAKVAGTEQGVVQPTATFSTCFGGAFMTLPARAYAELFMRKLQRHGIPGVYLVNTGWTGGGYGVGRRMDITATRQIVAAILDGSIREAELTLPDPVFQLRKPRTLRGLDPQVLDPSKAWEDGLAFHDTCAKLCELFTANFMNTLYAATTQQAQDLEMKMNKDTLVVMST